MLRSKQKFFKIILAVFLIASPLAAGAAGLVPCGGDAPEKPCTVYDAFYGVARVTNWLLMLAGVYAVFRIGQSGFWLVISRGNDEIITQYRKALTNTVVGFVLSMLAYVLVSTAANGILAQGNENYRVDLLNPFKYVCVGSAQCPK